MGVRPRDEEQDEQLHDMASLLRLQSGLRRAHGHGAQPVWPRALSSSASSSSSKPPRAHGDREDVTQHPRVRVRSSGKVAPAARSFDDRVWSGVGGAGTGASVGIGEEWHELDGQARARLSKSDLVCGGQAQMTKMDRHESDGSELVSSWDFQQFRAYISDTEVAESGASHMALLRCQPSTRGGMVCVWGGERCLEAHSRVAVCSQASGSGRRHQPASRTASALRRIV